MGLHLFKAAHWTLHILLAEILRHLPSAQHQKSHSPHCLAPELALQA
jgi:hypothetical protein